MKEISNSIDFIQDIEINTLKSGEEGRHTYNYKVVNKPRPCLLEQGGVTLLESGCIEKQMHRRKSLDRQFVEQLV